MMIHMHKRTSKQKEHLRRVGVYALMTLAVVVTVSLLMLSVGNYWFNRETGTLEQRGLVQFASTPAGATVEIGDKTITARTPTKSSVEPGEQRFVMWREGYQSWIKNVDVRAGNVVWLNYARLVPKELPVEAISSYAHIEASLASPDKESLLLQINPARPEFRLVDISRDTPEGRTITLPDSAYAYDEMVQGEDEQSHPVPHTFRAERWDESSRYVLVRDRYGEREDLIVLDTEQPARSRNLSREFSLPFDEARFSGRSGNVLYVTTGGSLRKIDVAGGTISRSLISDIEHFELHDQNTVAYTTVWRDGQRTAGVYRDGDEQPVTLVTTRDEAATLSVATGTYYNVTYTAIGEGTTLSLYRGHHDEGLAGLSLVTRQTLPEPVRRVEFSQGNSHVFARAGAAYASYSIEQGVFRHNTLENGSSADFAWLDGVNLGFTASGTLSMRELDGANRYDIMPASAGHAATLSRNGTFLYGVSQQPDGSYQVQRVRMILR